MTRIPRTDRPSSQPSPRLCCTASNDASVTRPNHPGDSLSAGHRPRHRGGPSRLNGHSVALRVRWNNARDHQRHLEEEHMSTIGFIGVGEIASAMVEGLHSATESAASGDGYSFFLSPRSTERSAHLAKTIEAAEVCDSNQDVVDRSELIVLAVLPQQAAAVLDELDIPADRTLISAVAGLATDQLAEHLPHSPTIVRIIPLPAVR